jgi:Flp pilus assembly protein TadG
MPPACPGWRRLRVDARGTTAVEFALVAPLLFAILFGIITFGAHYAARIALTYAAAEGGRAAVAGLDDDDRIALAKAAAAGSLAVMAPLVDPDEAHVNAVVASDNGEETITVTIAYDDTRFAVMPFLPDLSSMAPVSVAYRVSDPLG